MNTRLEGPEIMILRGGAIGDFVMTVPVFHALRAQWPNARISLAAPERVRRLALETGLADSFESLDKAEFAALFGPQDGNPGAWKERLSNFDVVLSYLNDSRNIEERPLTAWSKRVVHGSPFVSVRHAVDALLEPLAELGIRPPFGAAPKLSLPADLRAAALERTPLLREGATAIHPGSGSPGKNWHAAGFARIAHRLSEFPGLSPLLIFGEADSATRLEMTRLVWHIPVLPACDLADLAATLAQCKAFVGNDSGIAHLAAAVGTPVTALFGPTDPALWGPRGDHVAIIRARNAGGRPEGIEPELVLATVLATQNRSTAGYSPGIPRESCPLR